jgi:hypothetical protein
MEENVYIRIFFFMKSRHSCLKQITELDNCNKRISHTENDCCLL